MRTIDADSFADRMYREAFEKDSDDQKWDSGCWIRYKMFERVLREAPTITIEPERKKGRWVFVRKVSPVYNYQGVKLWGNEYRCSCCGYRDMAIENFKSCAFCPNCGIEMEVE